MCDKDIPKKTVQFFDQLKKDPNRHLVLNQNIQQKQSNDQILNRIQEANERWNHFFNWDLSRLDLVAKYFDQLNLCQQCIEHFSTEQKTSNDTDDDEEEDSE